MPSYNFCPTVCLGNDAYSMDISWEGTVNGFKILAVDVYLGNVWLNDMLNDKTLEYFYCIAKQQLEMHLTINGM